MIFVEYNTKTRMGIWMCLLMMLMILVMVLAGVYYTAYEENIEVNGTSPDEDAVYVNAGVQETTASVTTSATTVATTSAVISSTTRAESVITTSEATSAAETEKRALYYVTVSGGDIVLLDEYGEFLQTVYEDAMFLPKEDLAVLRSGIALYSKAEMMSFLDDFS